MMVNPGFITANTPAPDGNTSVNYRNGSNQDIINTIHNNLSRAVLQTRKIAHAFKGANVLSTVKNIQEYMVKNFIYKNDGYFNQAIRLPSDLVSNKIGDCKSFALFGAGILLNLGIPNRLRYVSYKAADPMPGHVYNVAFDENNNLVILDAVWQLFGGSFNTEKPAKYIKDYNMKISSISGVDTIIGASIFRKRLQSAPAAKLQSTVSSKYPLKTKAKPCPCMIGGDDPVGNIFKKAAKAVKKAAVKVQDKVKSTAVVKAAAKAQTKVKNTGIIKAAAKAQAAVKKIDPKKLWTGLKTGLLIAPRTAFLSLVALNVHDFAKNLAAADQGALKTKWNKLGGNFTQLSKAVDIGKGKKRILGFGNRGILLTPDKPIGDPAIVAILASAATIIAALSGFLGKKSTEGAAEDVAAAAGEGGAGGEGGEGGGGWEKATDILNAGADLLQKFVPGTGTAAEEGGAGTGVDPGAPPVESDSGAWYTKPLNLGAIALGAYFLGKQLKIIK